VPFLLRTGKALAQGRRTITIGFHEPPLQMFPSHCAGGPNELVLELTDEPEISLDVLRGEHTLFTSTDEVQRLWELCDPVLADRPPFRPYAQGSWGPHEALDLAGERGWRLPAE